MLGGLLGVAHGVAFFLRGRARSLPFDCAQGRLGSQPSLLGSYGGQAEMTIPLEFLQQHCVIPSEVEESRVFNSNVQA